MKNWTLRFRVIDKQNFDEIKQGRKLIETRAGTIKYQPIRVGDMLTFVCGQERCVKKISKRFHWSSIDAMLKEVDLKKIMPLVRSVEEMKKSYASYSGYEEKIKEHGLLGFELE